MTTIHPYVSCASASLSHRGFAVPGEGDDSTRLLHNSLINKLILVGNGHTALQRSRVFKSSQKHLSLRNLMGAWSKYVIDYFNLVGVNTGTAEETNRAIALSRGQQALAVIELRMD